MKDDSTRPIVIKRKKTAAAASHGGAWKIAYADFVTAMMAFFLLMWLLGSTTKSDLEGIAEYFQNPLKASAFGGSGSGDATSLIPGGGKDLTRNTGQMKKGDTDVKKEIMASREAQKEFRRQERQKLEALMGEIGKMIKENTQLAQFSKQILLDITSEGLRIQIVDEQNRPMFDLSSDELKPYTKDILHKLSEVLNKVNNKISIAGHTDATQYSTGQKYFSNWELSANRANSSRRELIAGDLAEDKIIRVVGLGSTVLFDKTNPTNPVNRRISIVVLNKKTEKAILNEDTSDDDLDELNNLSPMEKTNLINPGGKTN